MIVEKLPRYGVLNKENHKQKSLYIIISMIASICLGFWRDRHGKLFFFFFLMIRNTYIIYVEWNKLDGLYGHIPW